MQEIVIVAGPNGAGKTSFANEYLPAERENLAYLNADEIARGLASTGVPRSQIDIRAGREMLARMDALSTVGIEFMFETTLASLSYAQKIPVWRERGYVIALIFLRLPSAEMAIERVRRRVAAGGHGLPEHFIRKRFAKGAAYLESHYKPVVDEWYIWDSLEGDFQLSEAWDD